MNHQNTVGMILEQVAETLSAKFGKEVLIKLSSVLGGGCINHASKLETNAGEFFLKWNADCASDMFLREAESLNELKKAAGESLVVPLVYAAKNVDDRPGFLVLEYLKPARSFTGSDEVLGRGLAVIHRFPNSKFGFENNNYCGASLQNNQWKSNWAEFFRDNRLSFLLKLIQKERPLPSSEMKTYEKLLLSIPELVPKDSVPVLIHGDLWSGNYMQTTNGPALIDPAAYFADREMEFAIMTMFGGFSPTFYAAYNEMNPLLPDWKERNLLYQLYHVLNHYYLFGGGYQNQALRIARSYL